MFAVYCRMTFKENMRILFKNVVFAISTDLPDSADRGFELFFRALLLLETDLEVPMLLI
jgi:hypothetical protein